MARSILNLGRLPDLRVGITPPFYIVPPKEEGGTVKEGPRIRVPLPEPEGTIDIEVTRCQYCGAAISSGDSICGNCKMPQ